MRHAILIVLSETERAELEKWVRAKTSEQRRVFRAKIVLAASGGQSNVDIAAALRTRVATVSQWRNRFAQRRLAGLADGARSGAGKRYGAATEERILGLLDRAPPEGYARWSGTLMAQALGEVSARQVWRVLARHRISVARRRSWCVSTDSQFAAKAADIVGIYLAPPENAVVLCVDEKPAIQALERAQGYLRLPNGRALTGFNHEYKRHGTTTLFAALQVMTGQIKTAHFKRRRRREFLAFMNDIVADHPGRAIHGVLDNLNTHKPKHDRWLARHPQVHLHYTPTHASWLNQVEVWFSILTRQALHGASFTSPQEVRDAIDRFVAAYNQRAVPFEWRKQSVKPVALRKTYEELRH
jgi:transposase